MTYAICSSNHQIAFYNFEKVFKYDIFPHFSCHSLDEMGKYDEHLEQKDLIYDLIMRTVKMITNFARTG